MNKWVSIAVAAIACGGPPVVPKHSKLMQACRAGDAEACSEMMYLSANEPNVANEYGMSACRSGEARACELVGGALWVAAAAPRDGESAQELEAEAREAFGIACDMGSAIGCRRLDRPAAGDDAPLVDIGVLEPTRVAGEREVAPAQQSAVTADAHVRMCLSETGYVSSLDVEQSSGSPEYDRVLFEAMRSWRFEPYVVDGALSTVCASVTFVH